MGDQLDIFGALEQVCTVPSPVVVPGLTHAEMMARRVERRDRAAARLRAYGERRVAALQLPVGCEPSGEDAGQFREGV
jgi:hypothetical protein